MVTVAAVHPSGREANAAIFTYTLTATSAYCWEVNRRRGTLTRWRRGGRTAAPAGDGAVGTAVLGTLLLAHRCREGGDLGALGLDGV